jgi:hypothetical protein
MKYISYPKAFWCVAGGVILFGSFVIATTWHVSENTIQEYHEVVAAAPRKLREKTLAEEKDTSHPRKQVVKTIWLTEGAGERVVELVSESSEIDIHVKKARTQLVETFYQVHGLVQQELFYRLPDGTDLIVGATGNLVTRANKPTQYSVEDSSLEPRQRFRYFEAKRAVYDFHKQSLIAYEVTFWNYSASSHLLQRQFFDLAPEAIGQARRLTLHFSSRSFMPLFQAENLDIRMLKEGGLW